MNDYEKSLVDNNRNYTVVKSNTLVLNSRFQYSVNQQKMICYISSKVKPTSKQEGDYQLEYEFQIMDYVHLMGIEKNGDVYNEIKKTLQDLRNRSCWIYDEKTGDEVLVSWLAKVRTNKKSGLVKYKLDEDLVQYLFSLQERYLSYGLINILNFKSKYSIRIYELLKAHYDLKRSFLGKKKYETPLIEWIFDLDELKHLLMLDTETEKHKYTNFKDFRKKVIEVAQREINTLSDMKFDFEPITKGRKTVKIKFLIQYKNDLERLSSNVENEKLFNDK